LLGRSAAGLVVVQHSVRFGLGERFGDLEKVRVVKQGDNALSLFTRTPAGSGDAGQTATT
jgi:hypothetical protein